MSDLRTEVVQALGPDVDILVGSVLQVRPSEVAAEEDRIKQMSEELRAKKKKEAVHLAKAGEIGEYLNRVHRLVEKSPHNTIAFLLGAVLKEEKNFHQDMANRQHVNTQETKLEESRQRLRALKLKHALVQSLVGGRR